MAKQQKKDDTEPKPVWNTTTQGPVPDGQDDLYEVVGEPAGQVPLSPSGVPYDPSPDR